MRLYACSADERFPTNQREVREELELVLCGEVCEKEWEEHRSSSLEKTGMSTADANDQSLCEILLIPGVHRTISLAYSPQLTLIQFGIFQ